MLIIPFVELIYR